MSQHELLADFTLCPTADLNQYFGVWAIHEESFFGQLSALQNMDLTAHFKLAAENRERAQDVGGDGGRKPYMMIREGIAMVELSDVMTKRTQSMGPLGTVELRRQMRAANADPEVRGILLKVDSPGGTLAGTDDLAQDVRAITANKPVLAYIEDMGASAAYYVAAQSTVVRANQTAQVGSIGVMFVVIDASQAAKDAGLTVHVIKTGEFKALGVPGTEVTEKQLAYLQERINRGNDFFIEAVALGRPNMSESQVRAVADGRTHFAAQAAELGLIDGVSSLDAAVEELVSLSSPRKAVAMSETTAAAPQAATINDLKAAFPSAEDSFHVAQLTAGATMEQATQNYLRLQDEKLKAAEAKIAEEQKRAAEAVAQAQAAAQQVGNNPDDDKSEPDAQDANYSDAVGRFREEVKALELNLIEERRAKYLRMGLDAGTADIRARQEARKDAVIQVDLHYPGLRAQYMQQITPQHNMQSAPPSGAATDPDYLGAPNS